MSAFTPLLHVDPIDLGHADIERHATCFRARRVCQKLLARFIEYDLVTGSLKQPSNRDAKRWVVIDYVDGLRCNDHPGHIGRTEYRPPTKLRLSPNYRPKSKKRSFVDLRQADPILKTEIDGPACRPRAPARVWTILDLFRSCRPGACDPWPFAERNNSASEAFFALKRGQGRDACADAKRPNCACAWVSCVQSRDAASVALHQEWLRHPSMS